MKVHVVYELRREFNIYELVKIAKIPRSTYYYHINNINKPDKYEQVKADIQRMFNDNDSRRGYRPITAELKKSQVINHKTVQRLMKAMGLFCMVKMKKYSSYRGERGKVAPNLLDRNFKVDMPYKKWVTDVTEFSLFGQKVFLSPILDLYNREVISYTNAQLKH